jgi:SAM-dependent methyltransferase
MTVQPTSPTGDRWVTGDAYEAYMGRWSRPLAQVFVEWLQAAPAGRWHEVGCGTGALTSAMCELCAPASIVACDPSASFVDHARNNLADARASFVVAGAAALPDGEGCFWDEAAAADPRAAALDEGGRFPLCRPAALAPLFQAAGLAQVETGQLEIPTVFADFDDYWTSFLRGTGPAPSYVASLDPPGRQLLARRLRQRLVRGDAQRIELRARAWAVRGVSPG